MLPWPTRRRQLSDLGPADSAEVIVIQMRKGAVEPAMRTNSVETGADFFGLERKPSTSLRICSRILQSTPFCFRGHTLDIGLLGTI